MRASYHKREPFNKEHHIKYQNIDKKKKKSM